MSKKKVLVKKLIGILEDNKWTDDDILDFLGIRSLNPKSFSTSTLFRCAELTGFWLKIRGNCGLPGDWEVLSDIDDFTSGSRARHREEKSWAQETMKVFEIVATKPVRGYLKGWEIIKVRLSSCNLLCKDCEQQGARDQGVMLRANALGNAISKIQLNERVMVLTGGEPCLWQETTSLTRLLYNWSVTGNQVHLHTNGTIRPRKIFRDVFGCIVVSPKFTEFFTKSFWEKQIEWWEDAYPPIYSVKIGTQKDHKPFLDILKNIEPERVILKPVDTGDVKTAKQIQKQTGWRVE